MQVPMSFHHSVDGCCAEDITGACVLAAGATSLGKPSLRKSMPASQPQLPSTLQAAWADATGIEVLLPSLIWCMNNHQPFSNDDLTFYQQ